jgi:hypothetical protein
MKRATVLAVVGCCFHADKADLVVNALAPDFKKEAENMIENSHKNKEAVTVGPFI